MTARLILVNGRFVTLDPICPLASALVTSGDEIIYVGDNESARSLAEKTSTIIDLHGNLGLPGFTDSHIHFCGFAQNLDDVNLEGCASLEQALERVAARVAVSSPGASIYGSGWNHLDWQVPVFPDKFSLDLVSPNNPVILIRKDAHSAWVNSAALQKFNITRALSNPGGGVIERDADGEPNGLLREKAIELLGGGIGANKRPLSEAALLRAQAHAHQNGLTTIHNIEGENSLRAFQSLHSHDKLKLRVVHSIPASSLDNARALGIQRGFGDEWLCLQAIKIFADGSLGSQTAELRQAFVNQPDNFGLVVTDSATMYQLALVASQAGLDVWIHAIGDKAISHVLDIFAALRNEGFEKTIFRIEHVQHLHPDDLPRFAEHNVIASVQPCHQPGDMRMAEKFLGLERSRYSYAYQSLLRAGATLAFGSDCPVESLAPLPCIHAAVTRQNAAGEPPGGWFPEEIVSVDDAVKAYTWGGAHAANCFHRAGSLTPGKRADVIVLSQDIYNIPPREILNTVVEYTIAGGEIVYSGE